MGKFKVGSILEYRGSNPFTEHPRFVIERIEKDNIGRKWVRVAEVNGRDSFSDLLKEVKRTMMVCTK